MLQSELFEFPVLDFNLRRREFRAQGTKYGHFKYCSKFLLILQGNKKIVK